MLRHPNNPNHYHSPKRTSTSRHQTSIRPNLPVDPDPASVLSLISPPQIKIEQQPLPTSPTTTRPRAPSYSTASNSSVSFHSRRQLDVRDSMDSSTSQYGDSMDSSHHRKRENKTTNKTTPTVPKGALNNASQGWHFSASSPDVCANNTNTTNTTNNTNTTNTTSTTTTTDGSNNKYGLPMGIAPMLDLPQLTPSATAIQVRNYAEQAHVAVQSLKMALLHQQSQHSSLSCQINITNGQLLEMSCQMNNLEQELEEQKKDNTNTTTTNTTTTNTTTTNTVPLHRVQLIEASRRISIAESGMSELNARLLGAEEQHENNTTVWKYKVHSLIQQLETERVKYGGRMRHLEELATQKEQLTQEDTQEKTDLMAKNNALITLLQQTELKLNETKKEAQQFANNHSLAEIKFRKERIKCTTETKRANESTVELTATLQKVRVLETEVNTLQGSLVGTSQLQSITNEYEVELIRIKKNYENEKMKSKNQILELQNRIKSIEERSKLQKASSISTNEVEEMQVAHQRQVLELETELDVIKDELDQFQEEQKRNAKNATTSSTTNSSSSSIHRSVNEEERVRMIALRMEHEAELSKLKEEKRSATNVAEKKMKKKMKLIYQEEIKIALEEKASEYKREKLLLIQEHEKEQEKWSMLKIYSDSKTSEKKNASMQTIEIIASKEMKKSTKDVGTETLLLTEEEKTKNTENKKETLRETVETTVDTVQTVQTVPLIEPKEMIDSSTLTQHRPMLETSTMTEFNAVHLISVGTSTTRSIKTTDDSIQNTDNSDENFRVEKMATKMETKTAALQRRLKEEQILSQLHARNETVLRLETELSELQGRHETNLRKFSSHQKIHIEEIKREQQIKSDKNLEISKLKRKISDLKWNTKTSSINNSLNNSLNSSSKTYSQKGSTSQEFRRSMDRPFSSSNERNTLLLRKSHNITTTKLMERHEKDMKNASFKHKNEMKGLETKHLLEMSASETSSKTLKDIHQKEGAVVRLEPPRTPAVSMKMNDDNNTTTNIDNIIHHVQTPKTTLRPTLHPTTPNTSNTSNISNISNTSNTSSHNTSHNTSTLSSSSALNQSHGSPTSNASMSIPKVRRISASVDQPIRSLSRKGRQSSTPSSPSRRPSRSTATSRSRRTRTPSPSGRKLRTTTTTPRTSTTRTTTRITSSPKRIRSNSRTRSYSNTSQNSHNSSHNSSHNNLRRSSPGPLRASREKRSSSPTTSTPRKSRTTSINHRYGNSNNSNNSNNRRKTKNKIKSKNKKDRTSKSEDSFVSCNEDSMDVHPSSTPSLRKKTSIHTPPTARSYDFKRTKENTNKEDRTNEWYNNAIAKCHESLASLNGQAQELRQSLNETSRTSFVRDSISSSSFDLSSSEKTTERNKLYPEMLSPVDTLELMENVLRRSRNGSLERRKLTNESEMEGTDGSEEEEEEQDSSNELNDDSVSSNSYRYMTMEVPTSMRHSKTLIATSVDVSP